MDFPADLWKLIWNICINIIFAQILTVRVLVRITPGNIYIKGGLLTKNDSSIVRYLLIYLLLKVVETLKFLFLLLLSFFSV